MTVFKNIKELIKTLDWSKELLSEMFEKRNSFSYKYDMAIQVLGGELLKNKEFEIAFNKLNRAKNKTPISTLVCPDVTSVNPEFFFDFVEYDTAILIDLKKESLEEVEQQIGKDLNGEVATYTVDLFFN